MGTASPIPAGASAEREELSKQEDGTEASARGVGETEVASASSLRELIEVLLRSPVLWEAVRRALQPELVAMPDARPAEETQADRSAERSGEGRNDERGGAGEAREPAEFGPVSQRGTREEKGVEADDGGPQERSAFPRSANRLRRDVASVRSSDPEFVPGVKGEAGAVKRAPGDAERPSRKPAARPEANDWLSVVARMSEGHLASLKAATELLRTQNEAVAEMQGELERLRAGLGGMGRRTDREVKRLGARVAGIYNG
jgi:hypothetical protein